MTKILHPPAEGVGSQGIDKVLNPLFEVGLLREDHIETFPGQGDKRQSEKAGYGTRCHPRIGLTGEDGQTHLQMGAHLVLIAGDPKRIYRRPL